MNDIMMRKNVGKPQPLGRGGCQKALIEAMVRDNRRFMTGMRYNLPSTRPLACAVALDTNPDPTAMYVVPPGTGDEYNHALDDLVKGSKLSPWIWRAGVAGMPLPPLTSRPD
jgi:hypothetical protein